MRRAWPIYLLMPLLVLWPVGQSYAPDFMFTLTLIVIFAAFIGAILWWVSAALDAVLGEEEPRR